MSTSSTARRPHILLCSAWQIVNIGDIAHTPGMLAVLEKHFPEARITLWPWKPLTPAAIEMMKRRFPELSIVEGEVSPDGDPSTPELARTMDDADFFLHGSGPATIGWERARTFMTRTGRPWGVYGVTYGLYGTPERDLLSSAHFVYFRDSVSLERAKREGVSAPLMEWSPDTAFAFDCRDDARAAAFLAANDLKDGEFVCCIARLRYTLFWKMPSKNTPFDPEKHARNEEMKENDIAPIREAVIAVARQTDKKILLCPEDETQMEIERELILERLPDDVRKRVVWRESFWLPDEALSVYRRSAGLFGIEQHSPVMCIGHGIPAIVCRYDEQSTKGFMWRDIGLPEWLFDLDKPEEIARIVPTVLEIAKDTQGAKAKAEAARKKVFDRYAQTMQVVKREVLKDATARDGEPA